VIIRPTVFDAHVAGFDNKLVVLCPQSAPVLRARCRGLAFKTNLPHSEVTIRDLWTGKVTVIKHPSST
jgi:hypothetical protein